MYWTRNVWTFCRNLPVFLLSCTVLVQGLGIPMLYTQGTHFEIGRDIGRTFQRQILEYFELHPTLKSMLLPWYHTPKGKQVYDGFLKVALQSYPQYVDEMKGMAEGANVSFVEVFLMNFNVELSALINTESDVHIPEACSDLLVNHQQNSLLGHNEDNVPILRERGYFVQADIVSEKLPGGRNSAEEHFTAYSYPGELPGNAFSFNSAGLVTTLNGLYPKLVGLDKTGRQILSRAVMAATSMEDVVRILEDVGHGIAYGFSINLGVLPTSNNSQPRLWNIEVAPSVDKSKSILDVYEVSPSVTGGGSGNYFHVNMYRRLSVDQRPDHIVSSKHRTSRINDFAPPASQKEMLTILGDTQDSQYPIYRSPRKTDDSSTVATAFYDLKQCTLSVYKDNPKLSSGPLHVFPLPCHPAG